MWWYVYAAAQAFAQAPTAPGAPAGGNGGGDALPGPGGCAGGGGLLIWIPLFVVLFFMIIWPRQREEKRRRQLLDSLQKGADVVTIGGICGTIQSMTEEYVVLKLDDDVTVKFLRSAVARVAPPEDKAKK